MDDQLYVDSQEFFTTLPKPVTKQYEPKDYAHVLKALAEGKPVYYVGHSTPGNPTWILGEVLGGARPPDGFSTEKPRPEIAIDTPVWVRDGSHWLARHFAGYNEQGLPTYWINGVTSHSVLNDGYRTQLTCDEVSLTKPEVVK